MDCSRLPLRDRSGHYRVVVETPAGSAAKLAYRPGEGFVWSRPLPLGLRYPYDWGFFPSTRAPDGDPLDALVIADAPTYPGVILPCRILGLLRLTQSEPGRTQRNDRLLMVPEPSLLHQHLRDIADLPQVMRDDLAAFFVASIRHTDKQVQLEGWQGASQAKRAITRAAAAYRH